MRTFFKLLMLTLLFISISPVVRAQSVNAYIEKYSPLVLQLSDSFGIPPELILGLAIVESGAGNSKIALKLHNHFGIKASNKYQVINGYKTRFKYYESDSASFVDFCQYVKRRKYYAVLKGNFNYNAWLIAMAKSGYSGSPKAWKSKIKHTITKYQLTAIRAKDVDQQQP